MTLSLVVRAAGLGLAAAALTLGTAQAAAPNLVSSSPGPQSGWTAFPRQLRLTFDQPLAASGADVELMGPDGRRIRVSTPAVSKDTLTATPQLTLSPAVPGPYMVTWQARSASGEQGRGDFSIFVQ
jgi:methionine-rich copper-binding protein CopC